MHPAKRSVRTPAGLLLLSLYLLSGSAGAAESDSFHQGVRLFGSGEYAAAARKFELALSSEGDHPVIHYNLGSSYYKLGRYRMARTHFRKIGSDHKLAAAACYNLGLIAFRLHGSQAAIRRFQHCLESGDDQALRRLTERQLRLLREKEEKKTTSWRNRISGYLSTGIGYDNNVARVPDEILRVSNHGSSILDLFLSSSYRINGDHKHGNAIKFGGALTHYDQLGEYSSRFLKAGIYHYRPLKDWYSRYGAHYYRTDLGGEGFQQRVRLQVRLGRRYAAGQQLRLQYEYSRIDHLDTTYSYLSGAQQRLKLENRTHLASGSLRIGYTLELNNREDYLQPDTFSSYSPLRQTIYLWYKPRLGNGWSGRFGVEYRDSDYRDENIVAGSNVGVRRDQRIRATIGAIWEYSPDIELEITLRHIGNSSNLANKEYSSNQLMFIIGRYL